MASECGGGDPPLTCVCVCLYIYGAANLDSPKKTKE